MGDPGEAKAHHKRAFDDTAHGRKKWAALLEPALAPVTERLLDLARVGPGHYVLDVCCGLGAPTLAAARRVGAEGRVTGVDQARRMLAIAEEEARAAGLHNVGFQLLDAEELTGWGEAGYDAALSRFGLSFLPEVELALRGIHRVLLPGSWLAAANWGEPERVPFLAIGRAAAAPFLGDALPAPGMPGPFGLSRPGALEQALSSAGFGAIQGERLTAVVELPSVEALVGMLREATSLGQVIAERSSAPADTVWAAVAAAAAPYAGAGGKLSFPSEVVCVAARR